MFSICFQAWRISVVDLLFVKGSESSDFFLVEEPPGKVLNGQSNGNFPIKLRMNV